MDFLTEHFTHLYMTDGRATALQQCLKARKHARRRLWFVFEARPKKELEQSLYKGERAHRARMARLDALCIVWDSRLFWT